MIGYANLGLALWKAVVPHLGHVLLLSLQANGPVQHPWTTSPGPIPLKFPRRPERRERIPREFPDMAVGVGRIGDMPTPGKCCAVPGFLSLVRARMSVQGSHPPTELDGLAGHLGAPRVVSSFVIVIDLARGRAKKRAIAKLTHKSKRIVSIRPNG